MINDGMRGQRYFAPFNYVIELQEMCKQNKKYINIRQFKIKMKIIKKYIDK